VSRCLSRRGNGVICLFHVGSQSADVAALPRIIDGLRAHGYRFRTIEGLLGVASSVADAGSSRHAGRIAARLAARLLTQDHAAPQTVRLACGRIRAACPAEPSARSARLP
jgi:hypothetical protein